MQQLDRNWAELLQEIRVAQTGVQLLTGFLLSLPFQSRFTTLNDTQLGIYLAVVCCAILATGLLLAPVGIHRMVFRLHERRELVRVADHLAQGGLAVLGLAIVGVVMLIFSVTVSETAGDVVGGVTTVFLLSLWLLGPLRLRMRARHGREELGAAMDEGSSPAD